MQSVVYRSIYLIAELCDLQSIRGPPAKRRHVTGGSSACAVFARCRPSPTRHGAAFRAMLGALCPVWTVLRPYAELRTSSSADTASRSHTT